MPRYFFNVCSDDAEEIDLVGKRCANDVAALQEALIKASNVVQKRLFAESFISTGSVVVEDETHRCVLSLPLRAAAY
jgi:hypothetical protein